MNELNNMQVLADDFFDFLADCSTNEDFKASMNGEKDEQEYGEKDEQEIEFAIEFLADYPQFSDDFE